MGCKCSGVTCKRWTGKRRVGEKEDDAMGMGDEKRREEKRVISNPSPFSLFFFKKKKKKQKNKKKEKITKQKDQVGINLVGRS